MKSVEAAEVTDALLSGDWTAVDYTLRADTRGTPPGRRHRRHDPASSLRGAGALASTGPKRSAYLPDVPTVQESGLAGYEVVSWNGISVPASSAGIFGCSVL